jgi:rubrerythrin
MNRTGMQMSPIHSKALLETVKERSDATEYEDNPLSEVRRAYIEEAEAVGSVPAPASMKGMIKSGAQMIIGNRPQVFIDKLAERLAFERGGTRLYDALIVKFKAHADELKDASVDILLEIRNEEAAHADLIADCIIKLGADPTAQTPSADLVGVETMGLLQAVTDPRTSLAHTLHAALSAELVDNAGWETLIALAENVGQEEMAAQFQTALEQEAIHLEIISAWYETLTLGSSEIL